MNISFERLAEAVRGAERVCIADNRLGFNRFTQEEVDFYERSRFTAEEIKANPARQTEFVMKTTASSGIKLHFSTDSDYMVICADLHKAIPSRNVFSCDCFVNGKRIDSVNNFDEESVPDNFAGMQFEIAEKLDWRIELGGGGKDVEIYFPWSYRVDIISLEIKDGAEFLPIKQPYFICYGDSISQGYDALFTSNRYASRLSRLLHRDEICKAIGAEIFVPELAKFRSSSKPEFIISAYGTNNFAGSFGVEQSETLAGEYYKKLASLYPDVPIIALSPLWRDDLALYWKMNDFSLLEEAIKRCVEPFGNIIFARGYDMIPHETKYFGDGRLHPNDRGFEFYAEALYKIIKECLKK